MAERPPAAMMMNRILTRDLLTDTHRERLGKLCELVRDEPIERLDEDGAAAALDRVEILVTGWGCPPLGLETLTSFLPSLRVVVHAAGTVKVFLTREILGRVRVSSAAAANAVPVAEYTLAAILFANKKVFPMAERYREVRSFRLWPAEFPGLGNHRKTVGIVGASRIGRRVIALLEPFDHRVLVHDPTLPPDEAAALGAEPVELDDLLSRSDVVSLHAPLLPQTRGLLDARRLSLLPDGATLVNTARGAIVDHAALERELASGRIDAVLDTTEPEVLPPDSPLYQLPNVFLTPHVAGAMGTETQRMADLALDEIERFVEGRPLQHEVHARDWDAIA